MVHDGFQGYNKHYLVADSCGSHLSRKMAFQRRSCPDAVAVRVGRTQRSVDRHGMTHATSNRQQPIEATLNTMERSSDQCHRISSLRHNRTSAGSDRTDGNSPSTDNSINWITRIVRGEYISRLSFVKPVFYNGRLPPGTLLVAWTGRDLKNCHISADLQPKLAIILVHCEGSSSISDASTLQKRMFLVCPPDSTVLSVKKMTQNRIAKKPSFSSTDDHRYNRSI